MTQLINPGFANFLLVTAVMFFLLTAGAPKSRFLQAGMVICLVAAGFELTQLRTNLWALLVVAASPLPYFWTLNQPRPQSILAILTIVMLAIGSTLLFWEGGDQMIVVPVSALFAIIYGRILLVIFLRIRDTRRTRNGGHTDSLIGLVGTAKTKIDKYDPGMVELDEEIWVAYSKQPIEAGSPVRITRFDGMNLMVEKVNTITGTKVH
jgi:membrane-bound ClpP family serine protease